MKTYTVTLADGSKYDLKAKNLSDAWAVADKFYPTAKSMAFRTGPSPSVAPRLRDIARS